MKKFIKLILLLLVSFTVNSKNLCTSDCVVKRLEAKIEASGYGNDLKVDENDWVLHTRFKY